MNRRSFLLGKPGPGVLDVSCERLYIQYTDARSEGRVQDFLRGVARDLARADHVRLTGREWLARDDFRAAVEPLLRTRVLPGA